MARRVNPLTRRFIGLAFAVLIGLTISPVLAPMAAIALWGESEGVCKQRPARPERVGSR
jgi:hypothetical protein